MKKTALCTEPVKLTYTGGPNKEWKMQHCTVGGGPKDYPPLTAPFDTQPTFTFEITNAPGVTFDATAPVWVTTGINKPSAFDASLLGSVSGQGTRTLSFKDLNNYNGGDPVVLTYMLRFSDGTVTDPIIQNGGCCHRASEVGLLPTTTQQFAIELGVALVAGFIIAMVVRRFRRG